VAAPKPPTEKRDQNDKREPLTVEQRKHRIAEDYRFQQKMETWWLDIKGRDPLSLERAKILNGVIKYVRERIDYLANMEPPIQKPSAKAPDVKVNANPSPEEVRPVDVETKKG
jgi:hypothetical protein